MKIPYEIEQEMKMKTYFDIGLQYYVLSRHAVLCFLFPVNGNLFHHAVEMFLLAGLSQKFTRTRLKEKYHQHDLPQMWKDFKEMFSEKANELKKYGNLITDYNKWEEIRYPRRNKSDIVMYSDIRKKDKSKVLHHPKHKKGDVYRVNLEEMDEFFNSICSVLTINPDYIKVTLSLDARTTYEKHNHRKVWEQEE